MMYYTKAFRSVLSVAAAIASGVSFAASPDQFRNGQSYYGQPGDPTADSRVVELAAASHVNAKHGEVLRFASGGRSFVWQLNGLAGRAVELQRIAPAEFDAKGTTVHIGKDLLNRR
jgi:hypothetical protein